jgi:hypothetical protein
MTWAPDYPWGLAEDTWAKEHARIPEIWGSESGAREWAEMSWFVQPHDPDDPELFRWAAKWARYSAAPGDMLAFDQMWAQTDVRNILPAIQVPTTVIPARTRIKRKPNTSPHGSPARSSFRSEALVGSCG